MPRLVPSLIAMRRHPFLHRARAPDDVLAGSGDLKRPPPVSLSLRCPILNRRSRLDLAANRYRQIASRHVAAASAASSARSQLPVSTSLSQSNLATPEHLSAPIRRRHVSQEIYVLFPNKINLAILQKPPYNFKLS